MLSVFQNLEQERVVTADPRWGPFVQMVTAEPCWGPFVRVVTADPCWLLALAILALGSEPMLRDLWLLAESYVALVPTDPSVERML
jgi:hypothetical protein